MATRWGVSKTMAQIYALLFAHPEPLDTDMIMDELQISRGNASMNLHKLLEWGLIQKVEREDTRRDYFTAEKDVWQLTVQVIRQRSERELGPLTALLADISHDLQPSNDPAAAALRHNLGQMQALLLLFDQLLQTALPLLEGHDTPRIQAVVSQLQTQEPEPEITVVH
jgi:DNA-binding transcriptional regulator GbsR (MarR family)